MRRVRGLTFVSLLAPNADAIYRSLMDYLATLMQAGLADLGALCGATCVEWTDRRRARLGLLAAPVLAARAMAAGRSIFPTRGTLRGEVSNDH